MKEFAKNIRSEETEAEGFEQAYRLAVVDTYCELGMNDEAVKWLWAHCGGQTNVD